MKEPQKYHPNPIINAVAVAAFAGDKKVRADLVAILPELLKARNDELRAESETRNADRNVKAKEEALAILRKREGGKQ